MKMCCLTMTLYAMQDLAAQKEKEEQVVPNFMETLFTLRIGLTVVTVIRQDVSF